MMTDEELRKIGIRIKVARSLHERYLKRHRYKPWKKSHYREDREALYEEVLRLRKIETAARAVFHSDAER